MIKKGRKKAPKFIRVSNSDLKKLIEYVWESEQNHYDEEKFNGCSTRNHIFNTIKRLAKNLK